MAYTISYTDVANKGTITVEDGTINRQTTLGFPGRNTTAYGAVIAENFLRLLENFAATTEPTTPVEGQIWYDSTLGIESLKVYNGTNWVPASGISKSISTPAFSQTGDLWVDTDNQQLYLYTGGGWILVGPQFSEGLATGARADQIVGQDNNAYNVLRIEVDSATIGVVSNATTAFIPKATIPGFSIINPGLNLINRDTDNDGLSNFKFFGTAEKAENLIVSNEIVPAANFLRGDTTSTSAFGLNIQNNQGINYGVNGELTVGVEGQAGIIQHNVGGSNIDIRVRNNNITKTVVRVDSSLKVGINTEAPEYELDVNGSIQSSNNLFVNGTTQSTTVNNGSAIFRGGVAVKRNLNIGEDASLLGLLTTTNIVPDDDTIRDIGAPENKFRNVYATTFTGNVVGNVSGTITGRSTESDKLTSPTTIIMEGDVTTVVPIVFDGKYQDPNFDNGVTVSYDALGNRIETPLPKGEQPLQKKLRTVIRNDFVTDKDPIVNSSKDDEILINQVAGVSPGLKKTRKEDFLASIPRLPAGVIMPYGGETAPEGWLLCNGQLLNKDDWYELFLAIQYNFGSESQVPTDQFRVPDLRGRLPIGQDNMGGTAANIFTSQAGQAVGRIDGSETKIIDISNLPEHKHDLKDKDNNQFYAVQDRKDETTDVNVSEIDGPTATVSAQQLTNSGNIDYDGNVGQPFNIMPPTLTLNYIIYGGRE